MKTDMINQVDKNGLRHGLWEFHNSDSTLMFRVNYNRGNLHGPYTSYRSNGSIESERTYKNGQMHGLVYAYHHENGNLSHKVNFHNGFQFGMRAHYLVDGSADRIGECTKRKQIGLWYEKRYSN